jgi:predicted transcriptional regulator
VQRFSVSVDDELAEWIEETAEERGVSKAKVIRDAIETATVTGLVQRDDEKAAGSDLAERVEDLEVRVSALEEHPDEELEEAGDERSGIVAAFEEQLEGQPPTTDHGEQAVVRIFSLLVEDGPMRTGELREAVYPTVEEQYETAESMWQSVRRYLDDLAGVEHIGHGEWDADPSAVPSSE